MRETAEGCSNYEFIKYSYRPLGEDDSDKGKKIGSILYLGVRYSSFFIFCDISTKKVGIDKIISYNRITTKPQRRLLLCLTMIIFQIYWK